MAVGAFAQDILTRIINVHWGAGLAVEFTGRPSYLTLNHALSMNKVTISFWFRIPFEVANAKAQEDFGKPIWDFTVLYNCIPLLIFGAQQTGMIYEWRSDYVIGEIPNDPFPPIPVYGSQISGSHDAPMQPSCIGVTFAKDNPEGGLIVHIQTADMATGENLALEQIGIENIRPDNTYDLITRDASYAVPPGAEALGNQGSINLGVYGGNIAPPIAADKWHHILISWDLQGSNASHGVEDTGSTTVAGTDAYSLMYCAIDDVNKDKLDLPANWIGVSFLGAGGIGEDLNANPNAHTSNTVYRYAGTSAAGPQRVNVSFSAIPSNPLSIPAPPTLNYPTGPNGETGTVTANRMVEMAELQIFTDITLDTSKEANRRAFIDFERDENGKPAVDKDGKLTMVPVDPDKAAALLGKKPEILLHGSNNWIEGKNTGKAGVDEPEGQFDPVGVINAYTPGPSLTPPPAPAPRLRVNARL